MCLCYYRERERRLLSFRLAEGESQAAWEGFLNQLRERGLLGRHLKLVTTGGCPGLHAAVDVVYPYVPRQHCWVHKLRNVANKLRRVQQLSVCGRCWPPEGGWLKKRGEKSRCSWSVILSANRGLTGP